jgi:hypothetical protein
MFHFMFDVFCLFVHTHNAYDLGLPNELLVVSSNCFSYANCHVHCFFSDRNSVCDVCFVDVCSNRCSSCHRPASVVVPHLAWEDGLSHALHKPLDPHEEMRTWSVRDLVRWLESCDLAGPAEAFHQNGVAGCDFLGFASAVSLQQDLRLTPLCARKLICLRDRFLGK